MLGRKEKRDLHSGKEWECVQILGGRGIEEVKKHALLLLSQQGKSQTTAQKQKKGRKAHELRRGEKNRT